MFLWFFVLCVGAPYVHSQQYGPDPWNRPPPELIRDGHLKPTDNTIAIKDWQPKIESDTHKSVVKGDWFYKNILNIMLRRGHVQQSDDEVEILLNLRLTIEKWELLKTYAHSVTPLTDEMFRRADGYISEAVRKPTLAEISVSWMEHLAHKLSYYKVEITYFFGALTIITACIYLPKYISRRHIAFVSFIILYLWEALVSYKEAEKENYNAFVSHMQSCNWWSFWKSDTCIMNIPMADPIVMLRHMHPGRILMRLMSILVTEPLMTYSSVINQVSTNVSNDLWMPFRPVVNIILQISLNIMMILMVIAVLFNFILNIPISFNFLGYIASINFLSRPSISNVEQREHSNTSIQFEGDKISGDNLRNLLGLMGNQVLSPKPKVIPTKNALKRSSSAGRLSDMTHCGGGDSWVRREIKDKNC